MVENNLYELLEIADEHLNSDKLVDADILEKIKTITNGSKYFGLAQINPIAGDLEYNAKEIAKYIKIAEKIGLTVIAFPELALVGYPLDDTISRHPIVAHDSVKWLNGLAQITKTTTAIVGFLEPASNEKYYNSAAILKEGKIQKIVRKSKFSTFSEFNDNLYVKKGENDLIIFDDIAVTIGEDLFSLTDNKNANLIINCSSIPTRQKFGQFDRNSISNIAKKLKTPIVFANQVGTIDNISFDGTSCVYNSDGTLLARAKAFEEQLLIVNTEKNIGKIYPLPQGLEKRLAEQNEFSLDYENDLERVYKTLIQGTKDYFKKCGLKRAVIGLSGGLDSTVCAVILADAIGKENVFGISMPSNITSIGSKSDAEQLAKNLGINYTAESILPMMNTTSECLNNIFENVQKKWDFRYQKSFTNDNIQARARATYLWGVSNEFEACIPIATSDKSEAYMGYATINGDMSGGFAPIADITKTKLFALARWLNKNRFEKNAVPESIIQKRPGAELAINPKTGKPLLAEEALMPYEFLDEIIWRIENKKESYDDLMSAEFIYEKTNKISKEQKREWLDKFYKRMSTAFIKWSLMPPSIIIEAHSINKTDYKQPITSSHINYKGVDKDYVKSVLGSI